ncbi:MAG: DUF3987 domain-containing protein, partial [Leptolyngbyaceae cyanobacterium RM1_405_57]|nr:DUF3987 domain-containing protein [Leptolyngbyaceae cyanobacterium RM1_405_57]
SVFVDRVDADNSYAVLDPRMSLAGGIQPGVAKEIFSNPDDPNGLKARFLIVVPRAVDKPESTKSCSISPMLQDLYEKLENLPVQDVRLSSEAAQRYYDFRESLRNRRKVTENSACRNALAKGKGYAGRLALVLHCIECALDESKELRVLTLDTMERAIALEKFYLRQIELFNAGSSESDSLAKMMHDIQQAAERQPSGISLTEIYKGTVGGVRSLAKKLNRHPKDLAEELVQELVAQGWGEIQQVGRGRKYVASSSAKAEKESETNLPTDSLANDKHEPEEPPPEPAPVVVAEYEINEELEDHGGEVPGSEIKPEEPSPASIIKGSTVIYCGNDQSLARLCGQKRLKVVEVLTGFSLETVEVRDKAWSVTRKIPLADVRLIQN